MPGHQHSHSHSKEHPRPARHHYMKGGGMSLPSTASSGASTSSASSGPVLMRAVAACRSNRPLILLVLGAFGIIALIFRVLPAQGETGFGSSRSQRQWSFLKSTEDADFHPLQLAPFKGKPWRTKQTLEVTPVVATAFGVCEIHRVRAEDGTELEGWLWFDEKDQVNVLARLAPGQERDAGGAYDRRQQHAGAAAAASAAAGERKFLVFEQRKYGFEGLSLAPIGGLIEPGEEALAAAKRELLEEAGLVTDQWLGLGRYRISSTRGGGFLNVFFADDCRYAEKGEGVYSDDMENQTRRLLTEEELARAVLGGQFKEAKWTQTVTMALFHLLRQKTASASGGL